MFVKGGDWLITSVDKVHIARGDNKAHKSLDKEALYKLNALRFDVLEGGEIEKCS